MSAWQCRRERRAIHRGGAEGEEHLRIVLDGGPLSVETGGIRRYVEELSLALAQAGTGDEVHVIADRPVAPGKGFRERGVLVHDEPPRGWNRRWWLIGLPRACRSLGASVFHGTDFAVPYLHRVPAVMTIHDLSPWKIPEWQPDAHRVRRRTPWLLRLGLADQIITVSEAVRREVLARFAVAADRVHAIPLAANASFRPVPRQPGTSEYFLYVGTLEPRKNIPALVEAWKPVYAATGIGLRLAGRRRADFRAQIGAPGIEWMGAVDEGALPDLYSGAVAVVYPSRYEGFGLPVLEAMQCGAPVIAGDAAALRELVEDAGIVVNPDEPAELTEAMQRMAADTNWRREWAAKSLRRAEAFSWERTARQTREVYQEAMERFERTA